MNRGFFIVLEGIDGAGKSTTAKAIVNYFEKTLAQPCIYTFEPGGTMLGQTLRQQLLNPFLKISELTQLLLLIADRREHIINNIETNLAAGTSVVCDRFNSSTLAYQSARGKITIEFIKGTLQNFIPDIVPDLELFLDTPPHIAQERKKDRDGLDRFEEMGIDFQTKVYNQFKRVYEEGLSTSKKVVMVPASKSIDDIVEYLDSTIKGSV